MAAAQHDKTILCVGSDALWRDHIAGALAELHTVVRQAENGEACLKALDEQTAVLVLLDLVLPDISGLGLCRTLRERPDAGDLRVIMVSDRSAEIDRVLAFEAGVDDFLSYPFYPRELRSRVQAVLRRSAGRVVGDGEPAVVRIGRLEVDEKTTQVLVDRQPIRLTPREFAVLGVLLHNRDRVLRRREILNLVCGGEDHGIADRAIDAYVKALRRKLGPAGSAVETVRGVGYRFSAPHPAETVD